MALEIGRQGYLGIAIEDASGTPEPTPDTFLPFTENSLMDKHEPLMDISSRASRLKDYDAVTGKQWGEGDVQIYADATNIGYLLKLAFGQESKTAVNASVDDHLFYVTASGNAPTSATLWNYRGDGNAVRQYSFACIDTFELEVTNDDLAMVTAGFITDVATTVSAPTLTTTSGTVFTWKDMTAKFGATPAAAIAASATKLTNFKITLANNLEAIYRSGSNSPDTMAMGEVEVTGEYTLFLEDDTEIDRYNNLTKQSMVVDLVGAGLPSATTERLRMTIKKMIIEDEAIETDLGGFFAVTQTFRAIWNKADPGFVDFTLRNAKKTVY